MNRTEQQTEQTPHDVKQNHIVGGLGDGRLELPIRFRIGCGVIAMWNALQAGVRGALGGALDPPHLSSCGANLQQVVQGARSVESGLMGQDTEMNSRNGQWA